MARFNVGDMVIGNHPNHYGVTNKGWIGKVISVNSDGRFTATGKGVIVSKGVYPNLEDKYFDLYIEVQPNKIVITTDGKTTTAKMYRDKTLIEVQTSNCHPEVTDHLGIDRDNWGELQSEGGLTIKNKTPSGNYMIESGWCFVPEAFECEWVEPEVISYNGFKVGDRVNYKGHNATVICIAYDNDIGIEFDKPNEHARHSCNLPKKAGTSGKKDMCRWVDSAKEELKHGELPKYYNGKVVCVDNTANEVAYTQGKIYQMVDGQLIDDRGVLFPSETKKCKSFKEWNEWSTSKWLEVVE